MMTALLLAVACLQDPPKDAGLEELKAAWQKVIELCRDGRKDDLQKVIAGMELTRDEMKALFSEEKAAKAHPRYQEAWKKVLAEAADDLMARFKNTPWDEVEVWCLNGLPDKERSDEDRAVVESLAKKDSKVYSLRLKQKGKAEGFVLRCFVKTEAGWRMGLRIGKALAEK